MGVDADVGVHVGSVVPMLFPHRTPAQDFR